MGSSIKRIAGIFFTGTMLLATLTGCGSKSSKQSAATSSQSLSLSTNQFPALQEELNTIFFQEKFANAHWGVRVETQDGDLVYDLSGNKSFMPASQHKVFTTACALDMLGPDFTYETRLEMSGEIRNGVLYGDLIIVGSGDPSLGGWHGEGVKESADLLPEWVQVLREKGITKVEGRIIGDGRIFTKEAINTGWEYGDLPYWYACSTSGLAMEENCFRCVITPGKSVGDLASVIWTPNTDYINVIMDTKTIAAGERSTADSFNFQTEGNTIYFGGKIPLDREKVYERGAIWDGPRYSAFLFEEELARQGIAVSNGSHNVRNLNEAQIDATTKTLLLTHTSPPMSEMVNVVNKISHNFFADQIVRTLGYKFGTEGSFDEGTGIVREWLKEIGMPDHGAFRMVDGSGLSTNNRFQPRQATYLYRYMAERGDTGKAFFDSLPEAGVDGSLKRRMGDELMSGRVHAKTGYINSVLTLGGYIENVGGEDLVFSMMCNLYAVPTSEVNEAQDTACRVLTAYDF